ncbi:MAG TPA: hypothetical protein VFS15_09390 [Kofleriaceae bacterium]|nr:hypothetical protein [Kofleriaceae bacterium]
MARATQLGLVMAMVAGCGKGGGGSRPKLTAELLPPAAQPLMLVTSGEADVMGKVSAPEVTKDKAFGGESSNTFNDHPLITIKDGESYYELWTMGDGPPKLGRISLRGEGCAWVNEHIATLDGSRNCPGNRKTGPSGSTGYYCLTADNGHVVHVECSENMIQYWVSDKT